MTTQTSTTPNRPFRPMFTATITPVSIEQKTNINGKDYLLLKGATVLRQGKKPQTRTVMVFGKSIDEVQGMLEVGKPVELKAQYDGGSVTVVGQVREKQAAAS